VEPGITKREKDGSVYITITWSPLTRLTKDIVNKRIPSVPGIFEILVDDGGRQPELVGRSRAWYGGLRNTLRGLIDTVSPYALNGRPLDQKKPHYVRYAMVDSSDDMDDVLYFYAAKAGLEDHDDSGRYEYIYLNEEP
jgi:hypothetical protein